MVSNSRVDIPFLELESLAIGFPTEDSLNYDILVVECFFRQEI